MVQREVVCERGRCENHLQTDKKTIISIKKAIRQRIKIGDTGVKESSRKQQKTFGYYTNTKYKCARRKTWHWKGKAEHACMLGQEAIEVSFEVSGVAIWEEAKNKKNLSKAQWNDADSGGYVVKRSHEVYTVNKRVSRCVVVKFHRACLRCKNSENCRRKDIKRDENNDARTAMQGGKMHSCTTYDQYAKEFKRWGCGNARAFSACAAHLVKYLFLNSHFSKIRQKKIHPAKPGPLM